MRFWYVLSVFMFFVIGVGWIWLLLFIIPLIASAKTGPDWMDYMLVIFKFLQVAVLFIIECWNNYPFLSTGLIKSKNTVHHRLRDTRVRGVASISMNKINKILIKVRKTIVNN